MSKSRNVLSSGSPDAAGKSEESTKSTEALRRLGLEGVVALDSELGYIDGAKGELVYRGYDIEQLTRLTSFEEVAYLLWNGRLPDRRGLEDLHRQLQSERALPPMVLDILRASPEDAEPMAVLRTAVSALAIFDGETEDDTREANYRKSIRLTARIPTIIAAFARLRKGYEPVDPLRSGSTAFNFLYMLNAEEPGEAAEKTFDACLVLHAEHGLNASTFTGRVIGSTLSDLYAAITGAIGALKGPLHGGANIKVMESLLDIDRSGTDPVEYVKSKLAARERLMGFGHRVYKTIDPRATLLRGMVEEVSEERNARKWYDMSVKIMETAEKEKGLYPNVDFFSASVYYILGIDVDLYTPIFAMSRISGWTAHLLEQWQENRLIRPRAEYVGPRDLVVVPLDKR